MEIILRAAAVRAGLPMYFKGTPCRNGHIALRHSNTSACVECVKARYAKWCHNNPEKAREITIRWRRNNPEKRKEVARQWSARNPAKVSQKSQKWRQDNPLRSRTHCSVRRGRMRSAEGTFGATDIDRIKVLQLGRCAYFSDCSYEFTDRDFHIDHIVPLAKGGSNWPRNIQLLCSDCNRRKSDSDPIEFARRNGRLL